MVSRYWLVGRRRGGRRAGETAGVYVDRYRPRELAVVLVTLALALADTWLTVRFVARGGDEANPLLAWTFAGGGSAWFVSIKALVTVVGLWFLLLHVRFRRVCWLLGAALWVYLGVLVLHGVAAWLQATPADAPI